jgi:dolichyl-phosphate beta-glucosyltransferase
MNARGKYILFADADNSTPVEETEKFLQKIVDEGYDMAIGSRASEGSTEASRSLLRRTLSNMLRFMVHNIFQLKVSDTQCGFKMYKHDVAHRLHAAQTCDGFTFDLEILYLASKLGYRIAEIPVQWVDAPFSKVDALKVTRNFLRDLLIIKLNDLRGVYAHI